MALVSTVTSDKAEGVIKEGYDMFMKNIGVIPKPMELASISPVLFELQLKRIHYFSNHPTLSFALLVHIRYLVAHNLNYSSCMDFNRFILKKQGAQEDDIRKMENNPKEALLEEHEKEMLSFVVKAVKAPNSVTADDIQKLRDQGWEDLDMFDALAQGVSMIDHSIMMNVFQMDQDCIATDN